MEKRRKIDEITKMRAKLAIDECANKAARWAVRWNTIPLIGGPVGRQVMEFQWEAMAVKLGRLFELAPSVTDALKSLPTTHWVEFRHLWGRTLAYMTATAVPDFGLITRPLVEDLSRSMTKTIGWTYYLIIEEGRLGYRRRSWNDGFELTVSDEDLKRILGRAKSMP